MSKCCLIHSRLRLHKSGFITWGFKWPSLYLTNSILWHGSNWFHLDWCPIKMWMEVQQQQPIGKTPHVGGTNHQGYWTGFGLNCQGTEPRTADYVCMNSFMMASKNSMQLATCKSDVKPWLKCHCQQSPLLPSTQERCTSTYLSNAFGRFGNSVKSTGERECLK